MPDRSLVKEENLSTHECIAESLTTDMMRRPHQRDFITGALKQYYLVLQVLTGSLSFCSTFSAAFLPC